MKFNNTILLLGAGFSANFGGLLSRDLWVKIFNNPLLDNAGDIKYALQKEFNFENAYSSFFEERETKPEQFAILEQIIQEAYEKMNDQLLHPAPSCDINISLLRNTFINSFIDDGSGGFGACFSLNQDLFFENFFDRHPFGPTSIQYGNDPRTVNPSELRTEKLMPSSEEIEKYKSTLPTRGFGFIKLHGSLNWRTEDGSSAKIIGINKPEIIQKIPLLKWYQELFAEALQQRDIKLVVYGYSFRDDYINKMIYEALHGTHQREGNNIKIYIISTEKPETFQTQLSQDYPLEGPEIWKAVDGYFPYMMKNIFPGNGSLTPERQELFKKLGFNL